MSDKINFKIGIPMLANCGCLLCGKNWQAEIKEKME